MVLLSEGWMSVWGGGEEQNRWGGGQGGRSVWLFQEKLKTVYQCVCVCHVFPDMGGSSVVTAWLIAWVCFG